MKEIKITDIPGICIGQTENADAATGCTVIIAKDGMDAGVDIRGGGPSSRETPLLDARTTNNRIHAVVFAGGSSFGLGAADGVMQCLEEQGIGFDVGVTKVPLVVQSDIFDLTVGRADVRPDRAMGYTAARTALEAPNYKDGSFGAGCGASVGKLKGIGYAMKSGIGSFAYQTGELIVGAVVVVNSLGDVKDFKTGRLIAGILNDDKKSIGSSYEVLKGSYTVTENKFISNTTIGAVITNARFDKYALARIAAMGHNGIVRSIDPVNTTADGDSLYAVSVGDVTADMDVVGSIACDVVSRAIENAVCNTCGAYGLLSARDIGTAKL